ncbi:MAG: DUF2092 domain-containing protein [Deltaproteobacteria bacterium]|nr:DUF2092 domain-containing protein [Deltaproteobacteria bacterium]
MSIPAKKSLQGLLLAALLLLPIHPSAAPQAAAEVTAGSSPRSAIDPRALDALRVAMKTLSEARSFTFRADSTYDILQPSGWMLQFTVTHEFSVRRPDRAHALVLQDDGTKREVWYNGRYLAMHDAAENVYGTLDVPHSLDETLDYLEERQIVRLPVSDLLYSDLTFLETRASDGIYVGESRIGGARCDHLAFGNDEVEWQVWIDRGTKPLFRKFLITYKQQPGKPQFATLLSRWNLSARLPDTLFLFTPPASAERIEFLSLPAPTGRKTEGAK